MIAASKITLSHYNLKILRPKVTKNLTNLPKKFCEFRPLFLTTLCNHGLIETVFLFDRELSKKMLKEILIFSVLYNNSIFHSLVILF